MTRDALSEASLALKEPCRLPLMSIENLTVDMQKFKNRAFEHIEEMSKTDEEAEDS